MVVETTQIVPLQTVEGGTIRVSGTRINLETVVWKYIDGLTPEQILECYPDLDLAGIYAVISYYLSHREEVDRYLANQEAKADEVRQRIQNEAGYREWLADFKNGRLQEEQMSLAEIDLVLDELSEGTDHIPPLPPTFSREDIYFDHD